MFNTNDVYNDAVRDSSIHAEGNKSFSQFLMGSKIVATLLMTGIVYIGFDFYNSLSSMDEALVVKSELVTEIQIKSESLVMEKLDNSEEDYLSALRGIESELTEKRENVDLDTSEQLNLSSAMDNLMNDTVLVDNTGYTNELRKEIGIELKVEPVDNARVIVESSSIEERRTVIVKKGDTLQGISNKFYGDAMNYKRIIASNDSLMLNDTIYVGQTILLPY